MATCVLGKEQLDSLKIFVYREINKRSGNADPVEITRYVYEFIKNKKNSEQALNYAQFVPDIIATIAAVDDTYAKMLERNGEDLDITALKKLHKRLLTLDDVSEELMAYMYPISTENIIDETLLPTPVESVIQDSALSEVVPSVEEMIVTTSDTIIKSGVPELFIPRPMF